MSVQVITGGDAQGDLLAAIETGILRARPKAVGIASGFVSVAGVKQMLHVFARCDRPACRLVAGIDQTITHPEALCIAREAGWDVRLGNSSLGMFHPKLIIAGERFDRQDRIANTRFVYVGSGNLTRAALMCNVECAVVSTGDESIKGSETAFAAFWRQATPADDQALALYSARFAARSRSRTPKELEALGISDPRQIKDMTRSTLLTSTASPDRAISDEYAEAAWAGLQSFTGEFTFQIEFPRAAGEVVRRLIGSAVLADDYVKVSCVDGVTRRMKFCFYSQNGMFRLNVPNDVPEVEWARSHRAGVAAVWQNSEEGSPVRLEIDRSDDEADEIVARSLALGTWGRTSTRLYGWF